jgi:hypothetical protein
MVRLALKVEREDALGRCTVIVARVHRAGYLARIRRRQPLRSCQETTKDLGIYGQTTSWVAKWRRIMLAYYGSALVPGLGSVLDRRLTEGAGEWLGHELTIVRII